MTPSSDLLPVGRADELAAIRAFVERRAHGTLLLEGAAGAGKTTLWEAGCELALAAAHNVLVTRAREAETSLAFTGLGDLLDGLSADAFAGLPGPQRNALDVALLRAEPGPDGADPRAIAVGLLGVLRRLASSGPVLVCVDDVQWLDGPTGDALEFALRRAADVPVGLLAAERSEASSSFAWPGAVTRVELVGLEADELGQLLAARLGLRADSQTLRELERVSHGNPLFALEVGRLLARDGVPPAGSPLPHPGGVEHLVRSRVLELRPAVRALVLATALSDDLGPAGPAALAGEEALHEALAAGVVAERSGRLRPSHPLLGAAAVAAAAPAERRALHAELAGLATTPERRAHHRALATSGPDDVIAAEIAAAGTRLAARGAVGDAVALAEHALRLTGERSPARPARVLELGELLARAGNAARLDALLDAEFDRLPSGVARARAHLLRCDGQDVETLARFESHIVQAIEQQHSDRAVKAQALARRASAAAVSGVERLDAADGWSRGAVALAGQTGDADVEVLHARAWVLALRGEPIAEVVERAAAADGAVHVFRSVARVEAIRLMWRGEVHAARAILRRLLERAEERGEAWGLLSLRLHLAELELRSGGCAEAEEAVAALAAIAEEDERYPYVLHRLRAHLAALRGDPAEARAQAERALHAARAAGVRWDVLEAFRALGIAALAAGDPAAAVGPLEDVWRHTRAEGVGDPGAFPVAPDLVEALLALDRVDEARAVLAQLRSLAAAQEHPWGRATAERVDGLVRIAGGADLDGGCRRLAGAARAYAAQELRHDEARTQLALGRAQRRRRKWGAAREALEAAASAFARDGADGWAALAAAELERVGARRRASDPGALTLAEQRVAGRAAAGQSNKQIARELFVTVSTVEAHLSRVYAKLGVRSRSQLAGRFAGDRPASADWR